MLTGCTSSVYFNTEKDPMATILPNQQYKIFLPENPTIEDKKFFITLEKKMMLNGFNISQNYSFDYGVFFTLTDESYNNTGTSTTYIPQTSSTYGFVGNTYVRSTTTTNTPVTETYNYTKTYKKIYVNIRSSTKNKNGKYEIVWSGFMSSDIENYDRATADMVNQLVSLIGKDFKGNRTVKWSDNK